MFKVKGYCKLVHKDQHGNIKQIIEKENVFTKFGIRQTMRLNDINDTYAQQRNLTGGVSGSSLHISTQTTTPTEDNEVVTQLVGEAIWDNSNPLPRVEWVDATASLPMYGEMRVRLDAQGSSRSFQTIAIIDRAIQNAYTGNTNWQNTGTRVPGGGMTFGYAHSYLLLDNPVVQGAFDIIDIFYRLYFIPANGVGIDQGGRLVRHIGRRLFDFAQTDPWDNLNGYPTVTSFDNIEEFNHGANVVSSNGLAQWQLSSWFTSGSWDEVNASYTGSSNNGNLSAITGRLIKSIIVGQLEQSQYSLTIRNFVDPGRSKLQTSWAKRGGGLPFFNANDFSIGLGRIAASETWTGDYPEFYKIVITNSGDISTAEYNFQRMPFFGFRGNSWNQISSPIPQLNGSRPHINGDLMPGSYGTTQRSRFIRHNRRQVIWYNTQGITLMDVLDSSIFRHLGQNTETVNPLDKLDVTNVCQITSDETIIYVACRDTGLWEIDTSKDLGVTGYVTNVYTGNAYGVTLVNFGGVTDVVVATDQGLTSKLQSYASFSNPPSTRISTYGWDSVLWIEGNTAPGFTDGEIVMMSQASNVDRQILWWDRSSLSIIEGRNTITGGSTNNYFEHFSQVPSSVRCSPLNGWWAISYERRDDNRYPSFGRTTYGSTSTINCGIMNNQGVSILNFFVDDETHHWIPEFDKNDRAVVGSFSTFNSPSFDNRCSIKYFTSTTNIDDDEMPTIDNFSSNFNNNTGAALFGNTNTTNHYAPERLIILDRDKSIWCQYGQIYMPYYQDFEQYGWDGANWVLGSSGSKTVHATSESLIDGISISFDDKSELNPFFATDFYTLPLADGVLGDEAKTISLSATVFASNYRYQVAFPTGASVLSVPNVPPYQVVVPGAAEGGFQEMDVTDTGTIEIFLDGVLIPFSNILDTGVTPPAAGIVSVDKPTGTLTFHPSDINKEIEGYYSYSLSL